MQKISLYYKDGSSDKEYHTQLIEKEDGWVVDFQYGRRGGALKSGTKTAKPVDKETAEDIYKKLVQEKQSKGYSTGEAGVKYQDSVYQETYTGIVPQLLNAIEEPQLEKLFIDDDWVMQQKFDGERRLIGDIESAISGINRKGLKVALPLPLAEKIKEKNIIVDGEIIGEDYFVFDLLEVDDRNLRSETYEARLQELNKTSLKGLVVKTYRTEKEKRDAFAKIKEQGLEGVVFKRKDSQYVPGRPASLGSQLKFKFWESATLMVQKINKGKRSIGVCGFDGDKEVYLGDVTIPSNQEIPSVGDIVEIKYLYAYKDGSLYQPGYSGLRLDMDKSDCLVNQLKYKGDKKVLKS